MLDKHSIGYLSNHTARLFALLLAQRLKPLGIAPAQFPILVQLWQQDGLSQNELVERADLAQATIANTLGRMERDGLIERVANPDDARSRLIVLTDKAWGLQNQATDIAMTINREVLAVLSSDEQAQLLDMMNRIVDNQKSLLH